MRILFAGLIAIAAALLLAAGSLSAGVRDEGLSGGAQKIGYVDFNRALNEVSDGKRAKQRLKDEFQEKQQQLDRLQAELGKSKDSIDRDRLLLSPEAVDEKEQNYRRKFSELQQRLESFKKEMSTKESELTKDILGRLRSIVRDIGKDEGYTLILEKSQDVVLFAPEGGDLTSRVINAYDRGRGGKKK
ncbi:MAG: OmpH family outer membrane protein [Pseudomonadota bacterium]